MKRKTSLLCVLICSLLSACGSKETLAEKIEQREQEKRFIEIDYPNTPNQNIIVDKETNVQYLRVYGGNGAGLSVLVDAEGKPLLYEVGEPND